MITHRFTLLAFAALTFFACAVQGDEIKPSLPSEAANDYKLAWHDEFDGDALNKAEWSIRTGERFASMNTPKNVSVADGKLRIAKQFFVHHTANGGVFFGVDLFDALANPTGMDVKCPLVGGVEPGYLSGNCLYHQEEKGKKCSGVFHA